MASDDKSALNYASLFVMRDLIRVPRLVRLVRVCQSDKTCDAAFYEAVQLITALSHDDGAVYVRQVLDEGAVCTPTESTDTAWVAPNSWHFNSVSVFELVIRYYTCQILLSGATQTLCRVMPEAIIYVDLVTSQQRDEEAALSLAMCVEYGTSLDPTLPLASWRLFVPLEMACGTWHRLSGRQLHGSDAQLRTNQIKTWFLEFSNSIGREWKLCELTLWQIELAAEAVAGGPFPEFMRSRMDPTLILAHQQKVLETREALAEFPTTV